VSTALYWSTSVSDDDNDIIITIIEPLRSQAAYKL